MKRNSNRDASNETEYRYHGHSHIETKKLLQLRWIGSYASSEQARCVVRVIEEGNMLGDDVSKVFLTVERDRMLVASVSVTLQVVAFHLQRKQYSKSSQERSNTTRLLSQRQLT
jgi:hypothetical protein